MGQWWSACYSCIIISIRKSVRILERDRLKMQNSTLIHNRCTTLGILINLYRPHFPQLCQCKYWFLSHRAVMRIVNDDIWKFRHAPSLINVWFPSPLGAREFFHKKKSVLDLLSKYIICQNYFMYLIAKNCKRIKKCLKSSKIMNLSLWPHLSSGSSGFSVEFNPPGKHVAFQTNLGSPFKVWWHWRKKMLRTGPALMKQALNN